MTVTLIIVVMVAPIPAIGACFRLELGTFFHHGGAQSFQHFFQDAVLVDTQKPLAHLRLRVAVPQVKRTTQQVVRGIAGNPVGGLLRRNDLHYAAVVAPQQVIIAQHRAPRGKNGDFFSRGQRGAQAAVLAQLIRQDKLRENRIRMCYFSVQGKHLRHICINDAQNATVLLLCGEPIDEPIVGSGPFIMNNAEEIRQAIADYQSGKMGHMP